MKQVSVLAAVLAVTLGLAGCSCHRAASYPAEAAPVDNSAYQSDSGSKFGGKLGHVHHKRHGKCVTHKHVVHKHTDTTNNGTTNDTDINGNGNGTISNGAENQ